MPFNCTKPIVAIIGSRNITTLNLDLYIDPSHCGTIITGGATGVDNIAENWAKNNKIECLIFKPNYQVFGKRAPLIRDEDMANAADIVIAFWDGKSTGTLYTLQYCEKIDRKYICHLIIDL